MLYVCTQEDLNHRGGEIMIFIVMYVCISGGESGRVVGLVDEYMYNNRLISISPR